MIILILYCIIILFIILWFFKIIWTNEIKRKKNENYNVNKNSLHDTQFLILIPVFKEEKIIKDTALYFNSIKADNLDIYYITTDKELSGISNKNFTYEILSDYVDKEHIINYPYKTWDKASQLNYTIKKLLKQYKNKNLYFWIFDADSRPDLWAIKYISNDKIKEPVYQMLSVYNTNYYEIKNLCKANAILQTRWSFYFEFSRLLQNYKKKCWKNLMYLIWHGIFIRWDIIKRELFPENSITEDISYGYKLFLWWIFAKPVPFYYDYCSVPYNIKTNIKQISRRFYWEFELVFQYILRYKNSKILFFQRLFELIIWWYWWITIFIVFFISFFIHSYELLMLVFFWVLLDFISFYTTTNILFKDAWKAVKLYLFSIIKNLLDSIPLSFSLVNLVRNYIVWKKKVFNKTAR